MNVIDPTKLSPSLGLVDIPANIEGHTMPEDFMSDKFKLLLDSVPSAVAYVNSDRVLVYANDKFEKVTGADIRSKIGSSISQILEKETREMTEDYREKALRGEPAKFEMELSFNGVVRFIKASYTPDITTDGEVIGYIVVLEDVSERKVAERGYYQLAAIVHSSHDPIISKTLDGIITSWNAAAESLFGYTAEEMVGQSVLKLIPEDRRDEEPRILERLKRGEKVEHFETQRITKDQRILSLLLTISPIKDEKGNVIGASKIAKDISGQRKLFDALQENEKRLRMAIESTNLGTWEYFPGTGKLEWSNECREIFNVPVDFEIDYDFFSRHIHPDDEEWVQSKIEEALDPKGNGKYDVRYRIMRYNDGQIRWIRARGQVEFDVFGEPARFIGTVLDITEEKRYEIALKENIELFTTMADNVPAMIWMSGDDKFADYFNKTWLAFTGRTPEQECKEGWLENVHPDDVQRCIEGYNKAFSEQKGLYTEYRLRRFDGEYRWIADNSVARYNPDGSFAGFVSACIDIDDQKNFREKILKSELLLKTISNAAPVGLWMTDLTARCTFVNETWIEWTGASFEKQMGSGWMNMIVEEDRIPAFSKFSECLLNKTRYSAEFRLHRPNGEIMWCLTEGSPYYNVNGEFAGFAGSVTDITDIKRIEERKDDFIKMASHELKTPITSIKGYVQLLLNIYEELDEERFKAAKGTVRSSLNTISKQVTKLTRLVSELLDLSRIESGRLELHKTSFDLGTLIEEAVADVRLTTASHAIIVNNDLEGNVFADRDRISQVLLNLLTNAIKYSPNADCVEVFAEQLGDRAVISVKDYGIGIDKKDHKEIFQRFYRVAGKSEQTFPGFGIGLFIASEIVHRHNGSIFVESEKGKGAIFTVELPLGI